jgi:hypothetical protein
MEQSLAMDMALPKQMIPKRHVHQMNTPYIEIASISKLFTTLETFILRDRGILNW